MYSAPAVTPVQVAAPQKNAVLYSLAGISCLVVSLFLIAATIVVALIPVYMSNRSTAVDQKNFYSQPVTVFVPISTSSVQRRRRDDDGLDSYIGAEVGPSLKATTAAALKSKAGSKLVRDVIINSMTLSVDPDARKKRWGLTKRESTKKGFAVTYTYVFVTFLSRAQMFTAEPVLIGGIKDAFVSMPIIYLVQFNVNGTVINVPLVIYMRAPTSISVIFPALSPVTVGTTRTTTRTTVTSASNTTTVISSATAAATTAATTAVTTAATTVATTLLLSSTTTAAPSTTAAMTG